MAHITYVIDFKNYASKQNNYNKIEFIQNKIILLNIFLNEFAPLKAPGATTRRGAKREEEREKNRTKVNRKKKLRQKEKIVNTLFE